MMARWPRGNTGELYGKLFYKLDKFREAKAQQD